MLIVSGTLASGQWTANIMEDSKLLEYIEIYNQGEDLFFEEEYEDAIVALSNSLAINPDQVKAYYYRAEAYKKIGEKEKGLKDINTFYNYIDKAAKQSGKTERSPMPRTFEGVFNLENMEILMAQINDLGAYVDKMNRNDPNNPSLVPLKDLLQDLEDIRWGNLK